MVCGNRWWLARVIRSVYVVRVLCRQCVRRAPGGNLPSHIAAGIGIRAQHAIAIDSKVVSVCRIVCEPISSMCTFCVRAKQPAINAEHRIIPKSGSEFVVASTRSGSAGVPSQRAFTHICPLTRGNKAKMFARGYWLVRVSRWHRRLHARHGTTQIRRRSPLVCYTMIIATGGWADLNIQIHMFVDM